MTFLKLWMLKQEQKQKQTNNAFKYANTVNHLELFLKGRVLLPRYGDFLIAFGGISSKAIDNALSKSLNYERAI